MTTAIVVIALLSWGICYGLAHLFELGYEATWRSPFPQRQERQYANIEILGSREFVRQVEDALELLQSDSPDAFAVVSRYICCIRQNGRSGMRADADPPTFDFSPRSAHYSLTWCAGCIAHDAYHSKLYHDYREAHGEPVPDDAWGGKVKESECNEFQLAALHDISAPEDEIKYLAAQDGSHFDLDGDGKRTWNDYRIQNW